ncbi:MAG TPA: hypothetical protein VLT89_00100, partial [Usitatibacter sp.]|nr:hypothetical protein [Usitatibacter sp.]
MAATPLPSLMWIGIGALVLWRLYSRIRRMVGRQRSKLTRHWIQAVLFPLVTAMLALSALASPTAEGALAIGLAVGIGLATYGLRLTKFEVLPQGHYYTPNAHLGIALSLLFIARIGWRFYEVSQMTDAAKANQMQDFGRSPLTLLVFGMLAAYYTTYAIGIIRWRKANPRPPAAAPEEPQP